MKQSSYKSYEDLPLFLNVNDLSKAIGIAPSSCYELMHEKDFPSIRIGKRLVVQREKFIEWVDEQSKGGRK
ncbi:MAG: helix-turn-helix domain-containing protein [Oscillospiraceae bacterium]|nr:helix-turn-helix domain-containing protein [Oscillospiraceae bacterium]